MLKSETKKKLIKLWRVCVWDVWPANKGNRKEERTLENSKENFGKTQEKGEN